MAVGKGGWSVNELRSGKGPGGINQVAATDFAIARRRQLSAYQVAFVGEQKESAALGRNVDAGAVFRFRNCVRTPELRAGRSFEADEFA